MTEMSKALTEAKFQFEGQTNVYHGKVRDVYSIGEDLLVMVASDRISAFDHILPKGIPFKGEVLNKIAERFLDETSDIVPNWKIATPDPSVTVGKRVEPFKVEMVIRGYCTGHAWREYKSGERVLCGVDMPEGMREHDRFPKPIITPATKAEQGDHDEDISREAIIAKGIVSQDDYELLEKYTYELFERGTQIADAHDLILVDTKYEFGKSKDGEIVLIDEIHTPDSSRYFYKEGYEERQAKGEQQKQLSKEFVREWLIENDFQGLDGQTMPEIPESFVTMVSERYIELFEKVTGTKFVGDSSDDPHARVQNNVSEFLKHYQA
jgi:phosphoribosylaminoimidazole-succinocarboxamide synthase